MADGFANKRNLNELYDLAKASAGLWGISSYPQFIGASENIVYRLQGRPERILRLTEERHRSLNSLRAEMAFVSFLSENGLPVTNVLPSENGKFVEHMRGVTPSYCVSVFEKAKGSIIGKPKLYSDADNAEKLGHYLGNLHKLTLEYKPALPWLKRHRYRDIDEVRNAFNILPIDIKDARMEFEKAIAWYDSLPIEKDSYGLIHMDVHGENIFKGAKTGLTLIDFDDCAYNFFAYDLAVPLYYLDSLDLPIELKQEWRETFISAYLEIYPLPQKWINSIDGFIRLRIIELYIWGWKMFGPPIKNGKVIHFAKWRNNNIDLTADYPKLQD